MFEFAFNVLKRPVVLNIYGLRYDQPTRVFFAVMLAHRTLSGYISFPNESSYVKTTLMSETHLSGPKRLLFRLLPTLILVTALVAIEFILRLALPSLENPFVTEVTIGSNQWYRVNRRYLTKYFPEERSAIVPEMHPVLFRKEKGPREMRIFCLGESTMFGTPYEMNANIPAIVRKQLRHFYPNKEIEVINLGASAINSNVIVDIAAKLPQYNPDLVLIYMGHNEFYGPDGLGASYLQRTIPASIQWVYQLRDLRIFKLLQRFVQLFARSDGGEQRNLMETVSQNNKVALVSPQAARIFELFERNLSHTLEVFRDNHIPVIISDVTSNLNFPPFATDSIRNIANWTSFCGAVQAAFADRKYEVLVDTLSALLRIDSTNAFLQFSLGKTYEAMGEPAAALPHLLAARDNDLLKFRAPRTINTIIRNVSATSQIPHVSADSLFAASSQNGIADTNLFWEHLHPTARGYFEIANLFVSKILEIREPVFSDIPKQHPPLLTWNTDSLSICWLDLAYADISVRNLTTHWPFSNYKSAAVVIEHSAPELQQIAWNVYTYKLGWNEGCLKTALYFQGHHQYREAQTTYEALLEDSEGDFYSHYMLAVLLKDTGRDQLAMNHYGQSINLNPQYPYPRIDLGLLLINHGDQTNAIRQLDTALVLTSGKNLPSEKASIYYGLSAAYANSGNLQTALAFVDTSLYFLPSYESALLLRNNISKLIGQR